MYSEYWGDTAKLRKKNILMTVKKRKKLLLYWTKKAGVQRVSILAQPCASQPYLYVFDKFIYV